MIVSPTSALLLSFFLLAGPVARPGRVPVPPAAPVQGCVGCSGVGGSSAASGGTCGGMVSIQVTVEPGVCKWFMGVDPTDLRCKQVNGCTPVVTRSWSNLPPNTALDFCIVVGGETLCLVPPPSSGSGSGSDVRPSAQMNCSDDAGNTRSFSIGSASCGLSASTQAVCSACNGI